MDEMSAVSCQGGWLFQFLWLASAFDDSVQMVLGGK